MRVISTLFVAVLLLSSGAFAVNAQQDEPSLVSGTYVADPAHSSIHFISNHLGLSTFIGRFNDYETSLRLDADNPANSALEVTMQAESVDIDLPLFVEHMSAEEWFDFADYPEITFTSTTFEQLTPTTGKVTGDLTIKGVTRPVTLDVKLVGSGMHPMANVPAFGIEARGRIKRSEFGMESSIPFIPDEVKLWINAEFHRQE